nr:MAG: ORF1 [TTV-like mini virus]
MPWWNYRPRRYRWRRFWRRPRNRFRRRYWRRRWVRRNYRKRKLKKIRLTQFQPKCIRKCHIKGPICLFQTTNQRINNDFDLYELSEVPENLPGGGGWGIKVFSLEALYSEHFYARNVWTKPNTDLPLARYIGCSLRLYQSEYTDYCFTYSNSLPLLSTLGMYNAMQPSIHSMLQNKIIVPSIHTYRKKKPYFKIWVPPPTQLENRWYFQQNIAKTPLLMTRATAMSVNKFYIDPDHINTNLTIHTLNVSLFQNRQFKVVSDYWTRKQGTLTYYLYASRQENVNPTEGLKKEDLIALDNTSIFKEGKAYADVYHGDTSHYSTWKTEYKKYNGNPFYTEYLQESTVVYLIPKSPTELFSNMSEKQTDFSIPELTRKIRYNPYADQGRTNMAYFKSNSKDEVNWQPPDNPELTNEGLPFWLLLWGFTDWHKKIKKHLHLETDYVLTMTHEPQQLHKEYWVPLSDSFMNGKSPYQTQEGPIGPDKTSWYPQLQYQNEIITKICCSGPGVTRIPDNYSVQALMRYNFYFKWGGSPPPMSTVTDPKTQPTYIVPGNKYASNSLQNPTSDPASILWSFDERRQQLTPRAIQRLQTDKTTKKTTFTGGSHFQEQAAHQEETSSETSSEEEEETSLYNQLQQQRHKQHRIKQRILKILQQLQTLE